MIDIKELNPHKYPSDYEVSLNLVILCRRLNIVRAAYGIPMIVTSGLRSETQQQQLIASGVSKASKSHHLTGEAADIYDPDKNLYKWCLDNEVVLEHAQLWCETQQGPWVHFQSVPPKSGKRFFNP